MPSGNGFIECGKNHNPAVPVVINSDTHTSMNNDSLQSVKPSGSSCNFKIEKPKLPGMLQNVSFVKRILARSMSAVCGNGRR